MILDKEVKITINPKVDRTYFKLDYYDINIVKDPFQIFIKMEDLNKSSRIKINVKCDVCNNEKIITYLSYNENINNYGVYACSPKCASFKNKLTNKEKYGDENFNNREKSKITNLEKYGVDNVQKCKDIKNKSVDTIKNSYGYEVIMDKVRSKVKEKYGKDHALQVDELYKKSENTKLEKYGDKNYNNRELCKKTCLEKSEIEKNKTVEKRKETCLERYNKEYSITSDIVKNKILKIFNEKYGGNTPYADKNLRLKSAEKYTNEHINYIKDNIKEFQCEYVNHKNKNKNNCNIEYTLKCIRTNKLFTISYSNLRIRILKKLEISPFFRDEYGKSNMEKDLYNFIKENYTENILLNKKDIIKPLEIDIYLPDLKLAFEFNGLFWHNEINKSNDYHLEKTESCEQQGIHLIHIYEDDWIYKQEIVKSRILNLLGKTSNKIYARKCIIKKITDNKLIREFLNNNHLQGFVGSPIKLGLFYNDELVSLMTFGSKRKFMKQSNTDGIYEMLRFCSKINTLIIGGSEKLFKFFIDKYKPKDVVSYADRSWSRGELYQKLGFKLIHKTQSNYYYVVDGIRKHRFNFRKDKLIRDGFDPTKTEHEIMLERKIYRIYDSGSLKFIWKFNI